MYAILNHVYEFVFHLVFGGEAQRAGSPIEVSGCILRRRPSKVHSKVDRGTRLSLWFSLSTSPGHQVRSSLFVCRLFGFLR